MKKVLIIFLFFIHGFFHNAQEKLGITNSNYSSTNSIQLNPSSSVDSRTFMQLNFIGINIFAKSNFAYLPDFSYRTMFRTSTFERSTSDTRKFLYACGSVDALSYVVSNREYGAGFFIRGRNVTDMRRVSYELAGAFLSGQGLNAQENRDLLGQKFKNAKVSTMTWVEYGINFGKMIKRERDILITLAGNLKYNTGINILYANILEFDSYNDLKGSFGVNKLSAVVKRNEAGWNRGRGFGLDLGITYKIMHGYVDKYYANSKLSNCDYVDYKLKVGISLRDAGYIRFKENTTYTKVEGSGHFDPFRSDTSFVNAMTYNFNNTTEVDKPILASLPTALAGQFDWNFDNNILLNVTLVKNLVPTRVTGVQGADLVSVCPRVEFQQVEVAVPLTLQKFIYPQLGFALRYRSFVVGLENVFPVFITKNYDCVGIYFSLGVSIFRNPACATKRIGVSDCPKYGSAKKKKRKQGVLFTRKKRKRL